jgi:hypothetical protein
VDSKWKINRESLAEAVIQNATSDDSSQNLQKALPPIPIILTIQIPENKNPSWPIGPLEAALPTIIAPWLSKEVYKSRNANLQCSCCRRCDNITNLV